ncbi:hypothetical protein [Tropicimonas sp. S265A]|uniref:hypothetical protein n=1 Tax=Tropicimonas sp. S265A TaxID=3415134 RepID=UPI003C7971F1
MKQTRLINIEDIPEANAHLAEEARRKLRLSGDGLGPVIKWSKMPAKIRKELRYAMEAEQHLGAPKLARQIDMERVQLAHARARKYLERVDPKRERERRWLGIATVIIVNMTIFLSLLVLLVRSQG